MKEIIKFLKHKRNLVSLLILLLLLAALPAGIYLSQKITIFKPKALTTAQEENSGIEQITIDSNWTELKNLPIAIENNLPIENNLISAKGYIYNIYDINSMNRLLIQPEVNYAKLNGDGSVDNWLSDITLQDYFKYGSVQALVIDDYIYLFYTANEKSSFYLYYAKINDSGTFGQWTSQTIIKGISPRYFKVVKAGNYVYLLNSRSTYSDHSGRERLYSSKINTDGSLDPFKEETAPSQVPAKGYCLTHYNNYLYITGGETANKTSKNVLLGKINNDGNILSWTELKSSSLPKSKSDHQCLTMNGKIYFFGGISFGQLDEKAGMSADIYSATINDNGTLGSWEKIGLLPKSIAGFGMTINKNRIYIAGGYTAWYNPQYTVYLTSVIPNSESILQRIDFPSQGEKCAYFPLPIKKKATGECFYSRTTCFDSNQYEYDLSCDIEDFFDDSGKLWITLGKRKLDRLFSNSTTLTLSIQDNGYVDLPVKEGEKLLGTIRFVYHAPSTKPSSLSASCTNEVLNVSWNGGGPSYELRGGMNLTKEQILDGSTWENFHPTSDDIVGRDLTQTSYSKTVGANNQFYTIWIQSKNQYGVSDRVFYPDPVRCSAPPAQTIQKTVSSITVNNQSLDLSGSSLSLTLPSSETNIPMQVSFSNGDSIVTGIRFIYTPPPQLVTPSSLSASCTNGVLTASWPKVDGAINYELRGGKGLTDRPDDNTWENFPESDKIIGRQLTNCSSNTCTFTTTSIQANASYFLWVHSRTNAGISDATKLSSPVVCSSSNQSNLPTFTKAECRNGTISISWSGAGPSYELRGGMNLTKEQILDGSTWENSHPTADDLVGKNLTSTSFSKSVGSNNQYYTIWIHSRNNAGVLSDRVFYSEKISCR